MSRFAAHYIFVSGKGLFTNSWVEIGGSCHSLSLCRLVDEPSSTVWLQGLLFLCPLEVPAVGGAKADLSEGLLPSDVEAAIPLPAGVGEGSGCLAQPFRRGQLLLHVELADVATWVGYHFPQCTLTPGASLLGACQRLF